MKDWILDVMEKGEWYTRPAISDLSNVSRRNVPVLLDELVNEGLVVKRIGGQAVEFSLAITRPLTPFASSRPDIEVARPKHGPQPSVAGAAYRPKWKRLKGYGAYAMSHQRLCEEQR